MMGGSWKRIGNSIRKILFSGRRRPTRRNRSRNISLRGECLEPRQLLSANQITYEPSTRVLTIEGTVGGDNAEVWINAANNVQVTLDNAAGGASGVYARSSIVQVRFIGAGSNDRFANYTDIASYAWGDDGNDDLIGGTGSNTFFGGAGDDRLYGNIAGDSLDGGDGKDQLFGRAGNDYLVGGTGDDGLYGDDGDDQIFGQDGADYFEGGAGNDTVRAGAGNDYILGGLGNDDLYGDDGDDQLFGHEGADYFEGGLGVDALWGGAGDDSIRGGAGEDGLYGQDGNDFLAGESGADYLDGATGNDALYGGADDDYLVGSVGNDSLYGQDGNDQLFGDDGNDYLDGGTADDQVWGALGDDYLLGGSGDDGLYGQDGNDQLFGNDGLDFLDGAAGIDSLTGGAGDDYLSGGADSDNLIGNDGIDKLYGNDGTDYLRGGTGNDLLWGGLGGDYLLGNEGDDTLSGEEGDDQLIGHDGSDLLKGGTGDDVMKGGVGDDTFLGGDGNDRLYGEDGADHLSGENGDDLVDGGAGNDIVAGDYGNDGVLGGAGSDQLFGNEGNDYLVGGIGDDSLAGGNGNDILIGGVGVDQINGEGHDDILIGGTTIYDNDAAKMRRLVSTWMAATPYLSRIQLIEDELYSAQLLSNETVFDDQVSDYLVGMGGDDWYFVTGYLGTYVPPGTETHQHEDDDAGHHHAPVIVDAPPALEGFAFIDSLDKTADRQSTELIHSLVPHADTPALQREHLSLYQLVRYDQLTNIATRSGNWSDPATWQNGLVPGANARVLIPFGVDVEVDGLIAARLKTVRVDGTLSFNTTRNTELRADTIIVTSSGAFEMGTQSERIASGVTARLLITDNGAIDRTWDPFGISRGLISHGRLSIYGEVVTPFSTLLSGATSGSLTLTLKSPPIGWNAGDTIVVASTTELALQNEMRRIVSVFGNTVVLDQALVYNHLSPSTDLDVHVENLTRNAVIESETKVVDRRGHVMFMHDRDVHIEYGGFYSLGRTDKSKPLNDSVVSSNWTLQPGTGTNQRARYPIHFHRNGLINDGNPSTIMGSAVVDSPGWGFVNHSSYVSMVANVAYDVRGAAFATEVGDEIGSFINNVAIGSTGTSEVVNARELGGDFGFQGDGFWFQGAGVSVIGNVAAGNTGHAFAYYNRALYENGVQGQFLSQNLTDPSIANGAEKISVGLVPIAQFYGNIGYASADGLLIRYHLQGATHGGRSIVADSKFWNNGIGVDLHYAESVTLRNVSVIHEPGNRPMFAVLTNIIEGYIDYENMIVGGYINGIMLPRWGTNNVVGGTFFNNVVDILIPTALGRDRIVNLTGKLQSAKISAWTDLIQYQYSNVSNFFYSDKVILNFGLYVNQRLYSLIQKADSIPFPIARPDAPAQYIGLTTQQLWDQYHVAIGGAIAPANAISVPLINGVIAPNI